MGPVLEALNTCSQISMYIVEIGVYTRACMGGKELEKESRHPAYMY